MKMNAALAALSGLSQETRLAIFRLLVQRGPEGLPAGKIGERLGLPAATLSFHLAHLEQCGLLHSQRAGRMIIYSADYATMNNLMTYLTENCCGGDPAACVPGVCDSSIAAEPRARRSRTLATSVRARRRA